MIPQPRATACGPHQRDERTSGAMPPRAPDASKSAGQVDAVLGKPEQQGKPLPGERDRLPHERDQNLEEQRSEPRSNVEQAARDIESGQLDTDLHNTPGVERVVRERHAANQEDSDRRVANRSADDLADKRGQTSRPSHGHDERKR